MEADFEEGRFSNPVFTHDACALALFKRKGHVPEQGAISQGNRDVFEIHNGIAESRWRRDEEINFTFRNKSVLIFDFVECIKAGSGFSRAGFNACLDPLKFVLKEFLTLLFGVFRDFLSRCLGLEKGGVVSGMGVGFAL